MTLYQKIINIYPELVPGDFSQLTGSILLYTTPDNLNDTILTWNYSKPQPTNQQLQAIN